MSDRQLLLEQKRQRLQELRQRRLGGSPSKSDSDQTVDAVRNEEATSAPHKPLKVDVGVQTASELGHERGNASVPQRFKEVTKFDKGVQTTSREEVEEQPLTKEPEPHTEETVHVATSFNERDMNASLKSAIVFLNEIIATREPSLRESDNSTLTSDQQENVIYLVNQIRPGKGKVPALISASSRPGEFIVCLNGAVGGDYEGFAIIYRVTQGKIVPVNFLGCFSPITAIRFDFSDSQKVIGGLHNGKVVVWELTDSSHFDAVLLPTLTSPNDYSSKALHRAPITSILQSASEPNSFITTCRDGLINTWSVNFLEYPKSDTITLLKDSTEGHSILSAATRHINHALILGDTQAVFKDSNFLSSMMVSTEDGSILQLVDDPKLGYVNNTMPAKPVGCLAKIGQRDDLPLIAATCYDTNIHIYSNHKEVMRLFTEYVVLGCFARPHAQFEFVSYGLFDELSDKLTTTIDLWNLKADVRKPLHSLRIGSSAYPVSGEFDIQSDSFYLGFSDGKVSVFGINNEKLTVPEGQEVIGDIV